MAGISVSKEALPVEKMGDYETRSAALGEYTVAWESVPAGFPPGGVAVFKGLPDDACQAPHWGVLLKGAWRISFPDGRTETVRAGEAYYIPAGHRFECLDASESIEFSPTKQLQETLAVVSRNIESLA